MFLGDDLCIKTHHGFVSEAEGIHIKFPGGIPQGSEIDEIVDERRSGSQTCAAMMQARRREGGDPPVDPIIVETLARIVVSFGKMQLESWYVLPPSHE